MKINHMNFSNLGIMLIKLYSPLGIDFVSFSNVLDSQRVDTPITNEWIVEQCHGKSSFNISTSNLQLWVHIIKNFYWMLFNIAF